MQRVMDGAALEFDVAEACEYLRVEYLNRGVYTERRGNNTYCSGGKKTNASARGVSPDLGDPSDG